MPGASQRRYDALLAGIPLAFVLTYLLGAFLFAAGPLTVAAASLTSGVFVADGLYRNPPTPGDA
jgi:hypothetical protein